MSETDKSLLTTREFIEESQFHRRVNYIFSESGSAFIKYNPLSLSLGGMMFLYQKVISPQISATCLYHPSCSNFSIALIRRYGIVKGILCSADRLSRCNKIAAQDISPIRVDEKSRKVYETVEIYHNQPE